MQEFDTWNFDINNCVFGWAHSFRDGKTVGLTISENVHPENYIEIVQRLSSSAKEIFGSGKKHIYLHWSPSEAVPHQVETEMTAEELKQVIVHAGLATPEEIGETNQRVAKKPETQEEYSGFWQNLISRQRAGINPSLQR